MNRFLHSLLVSNWSDSDDSDADEDPVDSTGSLTSPSLSSSVAASAPAALKAIEGLSPRRVSALGRQIVNGGEAGSSKAGTEPTPLSLTSPVASPAASASRSRSRSRGLRRGSSKPSISLGQPETGHVAADLDAKSVRARQKWKQFYRWAKLKSGLTRFGNFALS